MGESINLPIRKVKSISVVSVPKHIFGSRIVIQAHQLSDPRRERDLLDGHEVDQIYAKGDIKFFSRSVDISGF